MRIVFKVIIGEKAPSDTFLKALETIGKSANKYFVEAKRKGQETASIHHILDNYVRLYSVPNNNEDIFVKMLTQDEFLDDYMEMKNEESGIMQEITEYEEKG